MIDTVPSVPIEVAADTVPVLIEVANVPRQEPVEPVETADELAAPKRRSWLDRLLRRR